MLLYPRSNKARERMCLRLSNTSVKSSQMFLLSFKEKKIHKWKMPLIGGKIYFLKFACWEHYLSLKVPCKIISILSSILYFKRNKLIKKALSLFCEHHKRSLVHHWFQMYPPCSRPQEELLPRTEPHTTAETAEVVITMVGGRGRWKKEKRWEGRYKT